MKRTLLGATVAVALATPAMAADMAVKAPLYKAPPASTSGWTGCYVGGNVGGGWAHKDWFDPQPQKNEGAGTASGVLAGGQAGCDYEASRFVFGVRGSFDWANLNESHSYTDIPEVIDHSKVSWLATVTGRIGYVFVPSALVYFRGGVAWVRDKFTETCDSCLFYPGAAAPTTRTGWTIGGGLEYRVWQNWSVFVEYNFADFGRRTSTMVYADASTYDYAIRQNLQNVLFGVNYHF